MTTLPILVRLRDPAVQHHYFHGPVDAQRAAVLAQFEREVTSERIRDKIAASKRKGLWVGGNLPLGYEMKDGKIAIVEEEAELVRSIFRRYLNRFYIGEVKYKNEILPHDHPPLATAGLARRDQRFDQSPFPRRSDRSDSATCCGRNGRGSCSSTSVVPPRIRPPLLNHR
jgi:hypothetical protein